MENVPKKASISPWQAQITSIALVCSRRGNWNEVVQKKGIIPSFHYWILVCKCYTHTFTYMASSFIDMSALLTGMQVKKTQAYGLCVHTTVMARMADIYDISQAQICLSPHLCRPPHAQTKWSLLNLNTSTWNVRSQSGEASLSGLLSLSMEGGTTHVERSTKEICSVLLNSGLYLVQLDATPSP